MAKTNPKKKKEKPFFQHYDFIGMPLYIGDSVAMATSWSPDGVRSALQFAKVISTATKTIRLKPLAKNKKVVYIYPKNVIKVITKPEEAYCTPETCEIALRGYYDIARSTSYSRFYINYAMQALSVLYLYGPAEYSRETLELMRDIKLMMPHHEKKWEQDKIVEILSGNHRKNSR